MTVLDKVSPNEYELPREITACRGCDCNNKNDHAMGVADFSNK